MEMTDDRRGYDASSRRERFESQPPPVYASSPHEMPDAPHQRRFGANRVHREPHQQRAYVDGNRGSRTTTADFERVALARGSVRAHHTEVDELNFNFGEPSRRSQQQISNSSDGMHRLSNSSSLANPKYERVRASGVVIKPGASLAASDEAKQLSSKFLPPSQQGEFLNKLMNTSTKRPPVRPNAVLAKAVATRTLEQGSAPSPIRPPRQATQAAAPREAKSVPTLGWTPRKNETNAGRATAKRVEGKSRITLTPSKRDIDEMSTSSSNKETSPLRSSSRIRLRSSTSPSIAGAARQTRNGGRLRQDANGTSSSISKLYEYKRQLRLRAPPKAKNVDGTADQPIDLESDSDADSPKKSQHARADSSPPAPAEPRRAHWENVEVDLEAIQSNCLLKMENFDVWIGQVHCCVDVFFQADCMWLCSIRSSVIEWNLMPHLQLLYDDFKGVQYSTKVGSGARDEEKESEFADAADKLMSERSFVVLKVRPSSKEDRETLEPFYDPTNPGVGAGKFYLKALLRKPRRVLNLGPSADSGKRKRPASEYRSCESDEDGSDCYDVQLTYPLPPCSSDIVTITRHDISRLRPEQYLNDNIIDYYFKRLMVDEYRAPQFIQENVLFLSSHFYSRLCMGKGGTVAERLKAGYKNVSTWVTRTDFFSRSMIFIPINMDFLQLEWENSHPSTTNDGANDGEPSTSPPGSSYDVDKIVSISVKAPRQENSYDCGVYVLKFAEVMLENYLYAGASFGDSGPIDNEIIKGKLDTLITPMSFGAQDITQARINIQKCIADDVVKYQQVLAEQKLQRKQSAAPTESPSASAVEMASVPSSVEEDALPMMMNDATGGESEADDANQSEASEMKEFEGESGEESVERPPLSLSLSLSSELPLARSHWKSTARAAAMGFRAALFTSALFLAFTAQTVFAEPTVLNEANFDKETADGVWFVKFYAPWCGHCQKLAPVFDALSVDPQITGADVRIAKVDCTTERSICERFSVQSYPTLKMVTAGNFYDYAGARDATAITKFATKGYKVYVVLFAMCLACQYADSVSCVQTSFSEKVLSYQEFVAQREIAQREQLEAERSSQVVTLTSALFDELVKESKDPWIIKFYAPWCGHCKRLVRVDSVYAPVWHRLSKSLQDSGSSTKVAKVDCTVHRRVCSRFGVGGYPSLFYIRDGLVYKYQKGRTLNAFLEFLNGGWQEVESIGPIPDETWLSTIVDASIEWAAENTVLAVIAGIVVIAIFVAILVAALDYCLGENDVEAYRQLPKGSPAPVPKTGAKAQDKPKAE
ncbi:Protein disulfide-isomerase domain, partial [Globisporangium splendens]